MKRPLVVAAVCLTVAVLLASGASFLFGSEVLAEEGLLVVSIVWSSGVVFGGVATLLLLKGRGGMVGWMCLAFALLAGVWLLAPPDLGIAGLILYPAAGLVLVFPTGRLPSRRWRWAVGALAVVAAVMAIGTVGAALGGWTAEEWEASTFLLSVVFVPVVGSGIIRIINDYRLARGEIRQQLKLLALVLVVGSVLLLSSLTPVESFPDLNNLAAAVMLIGGPAAIGLAVARYRLYEIDRIVSRTVSYSLLAGLLGLIFFGLVAGSGSLIGESPLVVAGSTLAVAALFTPVRRGLQTAVDRRFNRARYDAARTVEAFSSSLRSEVDLTQVVGDLRGVIGQTVQPASLSIWLRQEP